MELLGADGPIGAHIGARFVLGVVVPFDAVFDGVWGSLEKWCEGG